MTSVLGSKRKFIYFDLVYRCQQNTTLAKWCPTRVVSSTPTLPCLATRRQLTVFRGAHEELNRFVGHVRLHFVSKVQTIFNQMVAIGMRWRVLCLPLHYCSGRHTTVKQCCDGMIFQVQRILKRFNLACMHFWWVEVLYICSYRLSSKEKGEHNPKRPQEHNDFNLLQHI